MQVNTVMKFKAIAHHIWRWYYFDINNYMFY